MAGANLQTGLAKNSEKGHGLGSLVYTAKQGLEKQLQDKYAKGIYFIKIDYEIG